MTMSEAILLGVKGGPAIRPGSHMPNSTLIRMGGKTILVDAGLGAARGVCDAGTALTEIDLILITHLHSDHYLELGPLLHTAWVAGMTKPVTVLGPSGLPDYWRGFLQAMAGDILLRIEDEGRVPLAPLAVMTRIIEGTIYEEDGLTIRAMRNVHPPFQESYALRFEHGGESIVISGDTAYMPEMAEFSRGADLLIHEAMLPDGVEALLRRMTNGDERLRAHILRSHTAAADVGRVARDAEVGHLALTHMVPDGDPEFTDAHWTAEIRKYWSGALTIGKDGAILKITPS
jgi:ribonuclease BN (tRNA processing enzyme)